MLTLRSSVALASFLGLACCATPPAEEDSADSDDAVTLGTVWRSSIDEGFYDDGVSTTLEVGHSLGAQMVTLTMAGSYCTSLLDIPLVGEHAHQMIAERNGCKLVFTVDAQRTVHVSGTIEKQGRYSDVSFALAARKDDAFVGAYADNVKNAASLEVTASSNASATLTLIVEGLEVASDTTANYDGHSFIFNEDNGCPLAASFSYRDGARRVLVSASTTGNLPGACPAGLPYLFR